MELKLTSPAFQDGQLLPARFTYDGANLSPPLAWENVTEGTRELAIVCEDTDFPVRSASDDHPCVHWVVYGVSPGRTSLPEGGLLGATPRGQNSFGELGYRGPEQAADLGERRLLFRIFALDTELGLPPGVTRDELFAAMEGHLLNEGLLIGVYGVVPKRIAA